MTMHARFSASASDRWLNCPGSLALGQGHSGASSFASAEGTMLHALGERLLTEGGDAYDYVGQDFVADGFEFTLDDEQAGAVTQYVEYVRGFTGIKMYEVRSNYAAALGLADEDAFGTADCVIWQEEAQHLHIVDAKFGRKFVSARENKQLILYAIGVVITLQAVGDEPLEVTLHIAQPRVSAVPVPYTLSVEELMEYAASFEKAAGKAQTAIDIYVVGNEIAMLPYLVAGESQCQWCPVKANCPALRKEVDESMKNIPDSIGFMSADALSVEQGKLSLIRMYCDAVETETLRRLLAGESVTGYKMVMGREGNRKWADEEKTITLLDSLQSTYKMDEDDLWSPKKPKTLPQIEKVLKKAKVPVNLEPYQVRSPAKPTMATANDPRETWVPNAAVDDEFDAV